MSSAQKAETLLNLADAADVLAKSDCGLINRELMAQRAALFRECAAMMREREAVQWVSIAGSAFRRMALYRGWLLLVDRSRGWWNWSAEAANFCYENEEPTLEAARAAAVAWVDGQEGE